MRPWSETEAVLRQAASRRAAADAERLAAVHEAGIDLDPEGSSEAAAVAHPHDPGQPAAHTHPHARSVPGERPVTGIIGAGQVGLALGVALRRAGWPVAAVASRDVGRRDRFHEHVPGVRAFAEATALVDEVELVILAVPDDAVGPLAARLHLYAGQAIVHTSGLLGAEVLAPAMAAGTQAGAFHPLVAFADLDRALAALAGATIAIEGDEDLLAHLAEMAEAVGGVPVRLPPGTKAAYHAAAVMAAGGVTALLDVIREIAAAVGLDEAGALRIYRPLLEQTLENAGALGIAAALTGPAIRGDAGTVSAHLAAIAAAAPGALGVYRALLARDIDLAVQRGALAPEAADGLRGVLAGYL